MIKIVNNEEELELMLREEMVREARGFVPTQEELDYNVKKFMNGDTLPDEYPSYAYIGIQYHIHGFNIDCIMTHNYHTRKELIEILSQFPPDVKFDSKKYGVNLR